MEAKSTRDGDKENERTRHHPVPRARRAMLFTDELVLEPIGMLPGETATVLFLKFLQAIEHKGG